MMFEKYMIVESAAHNVGPAGGPPTGFEVGVRLPYYRGLVLSLVEDVALKVDGEAVPRQDLRLTVGGHPYTLAEMETETEARWEMGEVATLHFDRPGGLTPGEHLLQLMLHLRIAYMPFPGIRNAEKTVQVA